jgi:hypothetical protein
MDDRELLERAAKAAGLRIWWTEEYGGCFLRQAGCPVIWNPLTDDGDAFRLFVRLKFHVNIFKPWQDDLLNVPGFVEIWNDGDSDPLVTEYVDGHDYEGATRRAIVRAAAQIGEKM